jgi:hypothetical protein
LQERERQPIGDRSAGPARLTPDGELVPIGVDESLTSLLFAGHASGSSLDRGVRRASVERALLEGPPREGPPVDRTAPVVDDTERTSVFVGW